MKRQQIEVIQTLIQDYMSKNNLTYAQFAQKSGVSERTIKYIVGYDGGEGLPDPKLSTLKLLYAAMEVEDWLSPGWD